MAVFVVVVAAVPPNYSKPIARSTSQYSWMPPTDDFTGCRDMETRHGNNGTIPSSCSSSSRNDDTEALLCDNPQTTNNEKRQQQQRMVSSAMTNFIQKPMYSKPQSTTNNVPSKSSLCLDLANGSAVNDSIKMNGIRSQPPLTCPNGHDGEFLAQFSSSTLVLK